MRGWSTNEDDGDGTLARDLVGDLHVAGAAEARVGWGDHGGSLSLSVRLSQRGHRY
jgi:hypothetical protein